VGELIQSGNSVPLSSNSETWNGLFCIWSEAISVCALALFALVLESIYPSPGGVLLLGLAALSYWNYRIGGRDVLYPAFTYTIIWTIVAAVYTFCPIPIDRIGLKTVAILLAGGASFSIGCLVGNRSLAGRKQNLQVLRASDVHDNPQPRNVLLALSVAVTLVLVVGVIRYAGSIFAISPQFLLALQSQDSPLENADMLTHVVLVSGGLLPVLTLWVLLIEETRRWKILLCAGCICLFPLFLPQRGLIMFTFCGCLTLFLLKRSDRSFRKLAMPLSFAALGIVGLMGVLSFSKTWVQTPGGFSITDGVWMYIAGPIATFNYAIYHPHAFEGQPAAVFSQILEPLSRLGLVNYQTLTQVNGFPFDKFVYVPFPGNVYTAYKPYYEDFGVIGCLVAFALFGFIEGRLFYASIRGNRIAIFCFAYLANALMFSTFDDFYHAFSRHLNILIFLIGYFWFMKRMRIRL